MSTKRTCPECGAELPPDAPAGVCPTCLLKAGMTDPATDIANDETLIPASVSPSDAPAMTSTEHVGSRSDAAPEIGTKVKYFGDYELLEEIARGGMGVVYKARQVKLNRIVALKMILAGQLAGEEDVKRFQTEAEAAAQLDHSGIVPIYEIGEHDGHHYFSMALVDGASLADQTGSGPLPPRTAARYVQEVADAVHYAHSQGVIHRDLKPANILIGADGQLRVTDFGVARVGAESTQTATGQILGTPAYMSPEQAAGKIAQVGRVSDVYSLGAVLYNLLTGRAPFQSSNPIDTLMQVLEQDPVAPSQLNATVPKDLDNICRQCLEKGPAARYQTAQELADDLTRFLNQEPVLAGPRSLGRKALRWFSNHPWFITVLASVCMVVLLYLSYWLWTSNRYLIWTATHPEYVAAPGRHSATALILFLFAAMLVGVSMLGHHVFNRLLLTHKIQRRPISLRLVLAYGSLGLFAFIVGVWGLFATIDAHVWEGFGIWENIWRGWNPGFLFASGCLGLILLVETIRAYMLQKSGFGVRGELRLTPDQLQVLRDLLLADDKPLEKRREMAIQQYREYTCDDLADATVAIGVIQERLSQEHPDRLPSPLSKNVAERIVFGSLVFVFVALSFMAIAVAITLFVRSSRGLPL